MTMIVTYATYVRACQVFEDSRLDAILFLQAIVMRQSLTGMLGYSP